MQLNQLPGCTYRFLRQQRDVTEEMDLDVNEMRLKIRGSAAPWEAGITVSGTSPDAILPV